MSSARVAVVVPAVVWSAVKYSRKREAERIRAEYAEQLREELLGREARAREKAAADAAENQRRLRVTSDALLASERSRIAGLSARCPANTGLPDLIYAGAKSPAERKQLEAVANELARARAQGAKLNDSAAR